MLIDAIGQLGRVAVIGGSEDYTGAPYFSGMASAKLGADMVHYATYARKPTYLLIVSTVTCYLRTWCQPGHQELFPQPHGPPIHETTEEPRSGRDCREYFRRSRGNA